VDPLTVNAVVFISDALRADHLGCYGAARIRTGTIDELAASGVRFAQAITAAPWTALAMTSIATGRYPHHHRVLDWGHEPAQGTTSIFGAFRNAGHDVGTFVFDDRYLFRTLPEANVLGRTDTLDPAIAWLRERGNRPFLLFIHSWTTHMPYNVPHGEQAEWKEAKRIFIDRIRDDRASELEMSREAYRIAVERQSEVNVAELLGELDRLGVRERTIVAFGADHGESWGERFVHKDDVQGMYHLHGSALHDEILHVPLIVSAPGLEPGVVESQVRTVDLTPTVLELAGLPEQPADGRTLLPLARGQEQDDRTALAMTSDRGLLSQIAVRRPPWKLIRRVGDGSETGFRLDIDPRETTDRAAEAPDELRELLDREMAGFEQPVMSGEEEEQITQRLEDLGYL
jgi:arylsulfatase A-like enzyme